MGQKAALLLEDFGRPGAEYEGAIDLDTLCGTMKNSPAIQQLYLLDCCRTQADDLYLNEPTIGSRVVSAPSANRGHSTPAQQAVLFPTIGGEQAFGVKDKVSVYTQCILDALRFAAADPSTGRWQTTTGRLLDAVTMLAPLRVPPAFINRTKPQATDFVSFPLNEIDEPSTAVSFVTVSDQRVWGEVEFECVNAAEAPQRAHSRDALAQRCCSFDLAEGRWRFHGHLPQTPPTVLDHERTLRAPVAYITLEVAG